MDDYRTLSNCCFEKILFQDSNGHGKCSECKENTVPVRDGNKVVNTFKAQYHLYPIDDLQGMVDMLQDVIDKKKKGLYCECGTVMTPRDKKEFGQCYFCNPVFNE